MEQTGTIFNIQHYSLHDGPGIRTVIFLKGCPLRCRWCANPESQQAKPELAWTKSECIGCKSCAEKYDPSVCPTRALHQIGEEKSVSQVMETVMREEVFYDYSEGGITLSGGEPLSQPEFCIALEEAAKKERISCAMETSGYAPWEVLCAAAGLLDVLIFDIKCMDDTLHRTYTGVSNRLILDNFKKVRAQYPALPILVRTPVIPGVNDTKEEICAIRDFLEGFENVTYELIAYHRLGVQKYASLNREYLMGERVLEDGRMDELRGYEIKR